MRSLVLPLLVLCSSAVWADVLEGRVVAVADGDTLTLLDAARQQHRIRLGGIDAPEKGQPYGQRSKQHLSDLAFGKDAKADCYARLDRWGRDICVVFVDGKDIGLAQINAGFAWWDREYANQQSQQEQADYEAAEKRAEETRAGLWQDADPTPPWVWRGQHH